MAKREPRRKGVRNFILSSKGVVEAMRDPTGVTAVMDKNGIVSLRPKRHSVSTRQKLAAAERLLGFRDKNHRRSPVGKARV